MNIVWFKRDLRPQDHAPLAQSIRAGQPVLLCYSFEPSMLNSPEADLRHWRFVYESLVDLQQKLDHYAVQLHIFHSEVLPTFAKLNAHFQIQYIFSYQKTSAKLTFDRDNAVKRFCKDQGICWRGCFLILSRVCILLSFIGEDNPEPIVDYEKTTREAKDRYWSFRQRPEVQEQLPMIWEKLCLPKNIEQYQKQGYNLLSEKDNPLDV